MRHLPGDGQRLHAAGPAGRPDLAPARRTERGRTLPAPLPRRRAVRRAGHPAARLGRGPPRTAPQEGHLPPVVDPRSVPRRPPGRLRLQPVLRPVPALGPTARPVHAPGAPGRGEAVRRLRRPDAVRGRSAHRRGARGAGLRGRPGRQHACGAATPKPTGNRTCPTGSARMSAPSTSWAARRRWWCPTASRQGRRGQPLPLRARPQPHLRRPGPALRRDGHPRPRAQAPGQGQGGGRGAGGGALGCAAWPACATAP